MFKYDEEVLKREISAIKDYTLVSIEQIQSVVHKIAVNHGWWEQERNDGEMIALIHSELSEMLEYIRKGNPPSDHIPEFSGAEEEAADVLIRVFDMASSRGWNLRDALAAKIEYNNNRPYKHGGKLF